ncbi:histidine phosphatase family protein [Fulvivirga ligni]|uniref:histidine phosphatase family protein n=1 Tax=Fulvivirga ligni TaxID=2904246 RepID=UPI001F295DC8|nr:histidine phosphatase family protein [Fulvivirga ligni]UII19471.1 histidine phosphatase family protein [Fulvivirga ligni]
MAQKKVSLKYVKDYYQKQSIDSCIVPFYDSTKNVDQIILIRHGQPDVTRGGWRNRDEAVIFTEVYDSVGVLSFKPMPLCPDNLRTDRVYYSNIPRARNTAERIFEDKYDMIEDARFREFERKVMPFFNIKMPLGWWLGNSRILWILGFNDKGIETFKEARQRAKENAHYLEQKADKEHLVILVAHGFHNKYVAKYLRKMGWVQVRKGGKHYTAVNILAREIEEVDED